MVLSMSTVTQLQVTQRSLAKSNEAHLLRPKAAALRSTGPLYPSVPRQAEDPTTARLKARALRYYRLIGLYTSQPVTLCRRMDGPTGFVIQVDRHDVQLADLALRLELRRRANAIELHLRALVVING